MVGAGARPLLRVDDAAPIAVDEGSVVPSALRRARSSTPTWRGTGAGSSGAPLTRRSIVSGMVGKPRFPANARRLPASPPSAEPWARWASVVRAVVLA
jgi:hypothetical protein